MIALLLVVFAVPGVVPQCLTGFDKTACGFQCLAAHGKVLCARTPEGVCDDSSDTVTCWDPPEGVRVHFRGQVPRPSCLSRAGKTVCGYHCQAHDNDVACAETPDGICSSSSYGITCWDPPTSAYCDDPIRLPRPKCVLHQGQTACGYQCEARGGQVRCAETPGGRCTVEHGEIFCVDPPPSSMCGAVPCRAQSFDSGRAWCPPPPAPDAPARR